MMSVFIYTLTQDKKVLVKTAKMLLAIVFLLATFWKLYDGNYLNAEFMTYTLATDERMRPLVLLFTSDYTMQELQLNTYANSEVTWEKSVPLTYVTELIIKDSLVNLAYFLSYFTIIIELLVGLFFALKSFGVKFGKYADYLLFIFLFTVYFFVSVRGFSLVLCTLGLMQAQTQKLRIAYLVSYFVIFAYGLVFINFF
jgi:hypothetical protein